MQNKIAVLKLALLLLLVCCKVSSHSQSRVKMLKDVGYSYNLKEYTKVALYMAKKFISRHTNTLVIMERCEFLCEEHKQFHMALLQSFLYSLNYTLNIQLFLGRPDERPWDYNLFIIDSWWAFEALRFHFPVTTYERQFYFFILLNMAYGIQHQVNDHMQRIFQMCQRYNVKNVVIMYRHPGRRYISFYTYQIFGPEQCYGHPTVQEVNRYDNGRLKYEFLFPDHMGDFHGCTLMVCGHIVEPLLTFRGDVHNVQHREEMDRLGGTEGEILKVVAKTLNITLRFMFPSDLNIIGVFYNSTGCFREIERLRAHIAIGSLSPSFVNSYRFSYSYAYHTTPYVFVVRGGMLFGPLKQLMNPFNRDTWLFVCGCLAIMAILTYAIEYYTAPKVRHFIFGPGNAHPLRNMLIVLLGNPTTNRIVPRTNFARFLFMAWMLLTFELRNGYQGKMFDSLRLAKRLPIPQTISELIDQDYTLLTAIQPTFYPRNKTHLMRNSTTRMHLVNTSETRLTTTELLDYLIGFNIRNWNTSYLTFIEENIYFFQCVVFFSKHSILRPSFDRKFKLLSDAGITGYIAQRHSHRHLQNMKNHFQSASVRRIKNRNLGGLYIMYAMMCQVCFWIFILELLSKKSAKLKRLMDGLN